MQIETLNFSDKWNLDNEVIIDKSGVQLVLVFGDTDTLAKNDPYDTLKALYPNAHIVGSSSAGNVLGPQISESAMVASAIYFEKSSVQIAIEDFEPDDDLEQVSKALLDQLEDEDLKSVFVISDGLYMNGTALANGLHHAKENILITGGLAGDDARFKKTLIIANEKAKEKRIVALGFYGEALHVSSGCYAGWDEFGAERIITKSKDNVVYEIDNEPALQLYKRYLGDEAQNLPSSALRFPLSIKKDAQATAIIRTILAVDEEEQSLTFAGDVPQGSMAKLMKTDIDGLIDGSTTAAEEIAQTNNETALGLVVSCVGRKLVMKDLSDEELEAIEESIGENVHLTGFYSYGELAPFSSEVLNCQLHNQTMTLTVIYES